MDDPIARLRAEMDQAKEGAREYVGTLWAFYSAALEEGFTVDQAFQMTCLMLTTALSGSGEDPE